MNLRGWRTLLLVVLAAGILLLFANVDAEAQCSMCRAALANNSRLMRAINMGVLVLLIPPVSIFCSIFILLRRSRGNG